MDQWERNRLNFEGCWQGTSYWYVRQDTGHLALQQPSAVLENTCYTISFEAADTGLWDGRGLFLAPGGEAQYPLSRSTYNSSGSCWQFEAAGGQSSLELNSEQRRFGHEINFFHGRSRSMLVLLWQPDRDDWRLQTIGAVAFRCQHSAVPDPKRPQAASAAQLLAALQGWRGAGQRLCPQAGLEAQPSSLEPEDWDPQRFLNTPVSSVFVDGLVCAVPELLPRAGFRLEVGCLVSSNLFQRVSIQFDATQTLQYWERRLYQPA